MKKQLVQKKKTIDEELQRSIGVGIIFGIAIGLCFGAATDNIALFVGVGIALGVAVGASGAFAGKPKSK